MIINYVYLWFFFFNDTATTEIYTLSLHDALPIYSGSRETVLLPTATADPLAAAIVVLAGLHEMQLGPDVHPEAVADAMDQVADRKSTRLNSSHANISYAVFCLKKKKNKIVNNEHK